MSGLKTQLGDDGVSGGWKAGAVLVAVCLVAMLPGVFSMPPVDRDESRFAQASAQMAEGGELSDWIVPRIQGELRLNKPPLIYWLQAGSALIGSKISGAPMPLQTGWRDVGDPGIGGIGWFRLPSVMCAILTVLVTWRLGRCMFDGRTGVLAGLMMGTCVMVLWDARQARADQLLVACTTLSMWGLWRAWRETSENADEHKPRACRWSSFALLWMSIGLGVLAKGPITPLIVLLTILWLSIVQRRWRWIGRIRPLRGLLIVIIMTAPWVVLVAREIGWSTYASIVFDETLGRSVESKEGHWGPPGYHLLLLPVLFWPGSLLTASAVILALRCARRGRDDNKAESGSTAGTGQRPALFAPWRGSAPHVFLLAWIIPSWIVFELVSTKLPHYTLPLYPAIAMLTASVIPLAQWGGVIELGDRGLRTGFAIWLLISAAIGVAFGPAALMLLNEPAGNLWLFVASAAVVMAVIVMVATSALWKGDVLRAQVTMIAGASIAGAAWIGVLLPRIESIWISSRLIRTIASIDPAGERPISMVDYREDSMVFLSRGRVDKVAKRRADEWLTQHPDGLMVISGAQAELLEAARRVAPPGGCLRGFNYSNGSSVCLVIVSSDGAPASSADADEMSGIHTEKQEIFISGP